MWANSQRGWTPRLAGGLIALISFLSLAAAAQEVRVGVLGLFHPRELVLGSLPGHALSIEAQGRTLTLRPGRSAAIRPGAKEIIVMVDDAIMRTGTLTVPTAEFSLRVPGKLSRHYRGSLQIKSASGILVPIVSMDVETAVASIVAAELPQDTPLEALKAQSVVTRSYLLAGKGRHAGFDSCDTTHCQFLREPPAQDSPAKIAAESTRGLVLSYHDDVVAAMYTRSCGGRTRTPAELHMQTSEYPYFSVPCKYCYDHPDTWMRRISEENSELLAAKGETGRLDITRKQGWSAIPSNNFTAVNAHASDQKNNEKLNSVILTGAGQGHGIGLCQRGARAMAADRATFREILAHYFPNTTLTLNPH